MEWTEKLTIQLKERFNYASTDCAASIISSSKHSKGASAILNNNGDSYMISECQFQNFFIVELCNEIKIDTIVLANLEFFSSTFKKFDVHVNDRYPPTKKHGWQKLGSFIGKNVREKQAFSVAKSPFTKYMKIEMLDYYGTEFYCPISFLKVYGATMIEDYRLSEEDNTNVNPILPHTNYKEIENVVATRTIHPEKSNPSCYIESKKWIHSECKNETFSPAMPTVTVTLPTSQATLVDNRIDSNGAQDNDNIFKNIIYRLNALEANTTILNFYLNSLKSDIESNENYLSLKVNRVIESSNERSKSYIHDQLYQMKKEIRKELNDFRKQIHAFRNDINQGNDLQIIIKFQVALIIILLAALAWRIFYRTGTVNAKPDKILGTKGSLRRKESFRYSFDDDPNFEPNYGEKIDLAIRDKNYDMPKTPEAKSKDDLTSVALTDEQFSRLLTALDLDGIENEPASSSVIQLKRTFSVDRGSSNFISPLTQRTMKKLQSMGDQTVPDSDDGWQVVKSKKKKHQKSS
ncbi:Sad1/UNC-like domain-containing protein [Rozella allomycis CSF55]|uniref:Sad1/UNC-like domain-containing protein n=1 Tax=Rozella allomycis (strain CSF55) TaxID=988480 RepID=A0A075ANP4_ROZAC|nr:Sad1/UNC-like domain-containing protein [Rozella allomycis CSF55]|eukprot:EPZ31499.1 Sad1/UNC-like domain-containing protein [Rozella allomycis CSF55]